MPRRTATAWPTTTVFVGSPQKIADELRPIVELGFRHILIDSMAPYDAETLERLPEVRELL